MLIFFVFAAAAFQLFGGYAYIRATIKGRTRPNRISWALWAAAPLISTIIIFHEGAQSWAVLPIFMAGFIPLLVLLGSYFNKQAYWKLQKFDYVCGAMGLISLVLWLWADQPVIAVVMLAMTDCFAALPTIRKAWYNPETETAIVYLAAMFGGIAGLANLRELAVIEFAFPLYLVVINILILVAINRSALTFSGGSKTRREDQS
jgi:hypothetical protein